MKMLFVAGGGYKNLWGMVNSFLDISGEDSDWLDIRCEKLERLLDKYNYDVVIFIDCGERNLMDSAAFVALNRRHFVIVSENSEAKVRKDLFIDDMAGGPEFFHHLSKDVSLKKDAENIVNKIGEINF